jgi:hypothetical protein
MANLSASRPDLFSIHRDAEKGYLLGNWDSGVRGSRKLRASGAHISALDIYLKLGLNL